MIYSYPLSSALDDGFVKEPAVATRENFDANNYDEDGLEKLKLEDGIRVHENTKVELEVYARQNQQKIVKPFMLVVATDTTHANALVEVIEDDSFFEGRYKGKIITVHSKQRGEERDETVEQLLTVEDPNNPTEIVVHVNMLNKAIDEVRAAEAKELAAKGYEPVLKHSRWCLLKRVANLTRKQSARLAELMCYPLKTMRAYLLKESFQALWEYKSYHWAGIFLDAWLKRAMRSRLEPIKKVARSQEGVQQRNRGGPELPHQTDYQKSIRL